MMSENAPVFGKRRPFPERLPVPPPPPILYAPDGFGDDPPPRKGSWALSVGVVGLLMLGAYEIDSWRCGQADPAHPDAPPTYCHVYSVHYGFGWGRWTAGARGLSFGGFGHAAFGHGGGG